MIYFHVIFNSVETKWYTASTFYSTVIIRIKNFSAIHVHSALFQSVVSFQISKETVTYLS